MNPPDHAPLVSSDVGPPQELLSSNSFLLKRLGLLSKERSLEAFQETGLSPYHYAVLSVLDEKPRETQGTIADALGYDRSQLVGFLDELETRGLITRQRDSDDRRRHLVSLTADGRETFDSLRSIARGLDDEFLAPLDASDRETLHSLLRKLATYHDPRCDVGRPAASGSTGVKAGR
jgi:DNA-binding MarR family transcriptional regulator